MRSLPTTERLEGVPGQMTSQTRPEGGRDPEAYDQARLRRDSVPAKVRQTTEVVLRAWALPTQAQGEVRKGGVPPSEYNDVWRSELGRHYGAAMRRQR